MLSSVDQILLSINVHNKEKAIFSIDLINFELKRSLINKSIHLFGYFMAKIRNQIFFQKNKNIFLSDSSNQSLQTIEVLDKVIDFNWSLLKREIIKISPWKWAEFLGFSVWRL